jgi:O-antigen/teichoic acid export membrane protein
VQKHKVRESTNGVLSTGFAQLIKIALQLMTGALLARMLTPDDFGVVALTVILTGLLNRFKDGGISVVSIRLRDMSNALYSDLYWLNIALGALVSLVCIASGLALAEIYSDERLIDICLIASVTYLVGGAIVQPDAQLRRELKFASIAKLDIIAATTTAIGTLALAYMNFSYWALVVGPIFSMTIHAILINKICETKPKMAWHGAGAMQTMRSAFQVLTSNILNHLTLGAIPAILGYLSGTTALGVYNRISSIAAIPTTQVQTPLLSVLYASLSAKLNDEEMFSKESALWITRTFYLSLIAAVIAILFSKEIIEILLGNKWIKFKGFLELASLLIFPEAVIGVLGAVTLSIGKFSAMSKLRILELIGYCAIAGFASTVSLKWLLTSLVTFSVCVRMPAWIILTINEKYKARQWELGISLLPIYSIYLIILISTMVFNIQYSSDALWARIIEAILLIAIILMPWRSVRGDVLSLAKRLSGR